MAATILTMLEKIRPFCGSRLTVLRCCGIRSRPPLTSSSTDEDDLNNEVNEEQEIIRMLKKRGQAIRLKRVKKEMEPSGPPERRLTWNAMEQIRYLNQEFPEEWTLQRLAVGFNVSTDVIKRALKSKFVPSATRKLKQDASAYRNTGQISSSTRLEQLKMVPTSKDPKQQLLAHRNSDRQLLIGQSQPLLPSPKTSGVSQIAVRTEGIRRFIANDLEPQKVQGAPFSPAVSNEIPNRPEEPVEEDWKKLDAKWDGELLSDHELEELAQSGLENKMKVVQKGREFFDSDDNFLYKI